MHKPYTITVLADIHGTLPPLEAVLADLLTNPPDQILVAGDFLGGPQPLEVLARLQSLNCCFILGNGEVNILKMCQGTAPGEWWTHRQFDLGRWIYHRLNEDVFDFLVELPEQRVISPEGCRPVRIVHGSPWDVNKLVFPEQNPQDLTRALARIPEEVLVFAHNHLPAVYRQDGKLAVNPGSVGNNLNGDPRASYATLTWNGSDWQPELHYIEKNLDSIMRAFIDTGFLEQNRPLARAFLESILTAENTALDYLEFASQRAVDAGYRGFSAIPDQIWLEAEDAFPWRYQF